MILKVIISAERRNLHQNKCLNKDVFLTSLEMTGKDCLRVFE
jgi:hypothetical protein